jgi:hypothetical protein
VAHQKVQDPLQREVLGLRVLSLEMSFEGTMVLNAELQSIRANVVRFNLGPGFTPCLFDGSTRGHSGIFYKRPNLCPAP